VNDDLSDAGSTARYNDSIAIPSGPAFALRLGHVSECRFHASPALSGRPRQHYRARHAGQLGCQSCQSFYHPLLSLQLQL